MKPRDESPNRWLMLTYWIILDHTNFFDVAIQRGARPWEVMPFLAGDEDSEEVGISDNTRGSLPPYWRMVINLYPSTFMASDNSKMM
jgi:hypothetical protein